MPTSRGRLMVVHYVGEASWPRYVSCPTFYRTDLEDDMLRRELTHPKPGLPCKALIAGGAVRP